MKGFEGMISDRSYERTGFLMSRAGRVLQV